MHCHRYTLREILREVLCCEPIETLVRFALIAGNTTITFTGDFTMQLPDDKTVSATVAFLDAKGNPAAVDGVPVWASDTPDVVVVTPAADGLSCSFTPVGALGTAQISVTADADLGAGMTEIIGLGTIEVVAGTAVVATINFGEPA